MGLTIRGYPLPGVYRVPEGELEEYNILKIHMRHCYCKAPGCTGIRKTLFGSVGCSKCIKLKKFQLENDPEAKLFFSKELTEKDIFTLRFKYPKLISTYLITSEYRKNIKNF